MRDKRGGLIVICGIDGSGKTLQSKKLHSRLQKRGYPAKYVEFPRYKEGFFGDLIARYLRGELSADAAGVGPYLASLPFACDRWELSSEMKKWLGKGTFIICNRYVSANMAHQGGKIESRSGREEFYEWVEKMEYGVFGIPVPRLHVWLDIDPAHALGLITRKGKRDYLKDGEDIHENLEHLEAAKRAYAEIAGRASGWITIRCSGDDGPVGPDEVSQMIWERVARAFRFRGG